MSITKVALIGATGNLGPAIHKALLDANFEVTILSREGSTSTDALPSHPRQKITKVDFESVEKLTTAFQGIQAVVSNVASTSLLSQKLVIDAAIAAGVTRFLPSDFGSDLTNAHNKATPFNAPKVQIHAYLEEKVQAHPTFSYTSVANGPFLDWSMAFGLFGDFKNHAMTLWDGGETLCSTTTLASVGKAVVGVLRNLDATRNQTIRVADTTVTQKELIEMAREIDGKEWTTKAGSTAEAYEEGLKEMQKPDADFQVAIVNQLYRIMFAEELGVSFEGRLDNEIVGLPKMTREEVKEVVRGCLV